MGSAAAKPEPRVDAALERLTKTALALRPDLVAVACVGLIAAFALLGTRELGTPPPQLDLSRELNQISLPTAFSALLLAAAGLTSVVFGQLTSKWGEKAWPRLLAGVLLFMAFDEAATLHERPEELTSVPWQVFYVPIAILAAVAWGGTLRLCRGVERLGLILGAASWVLAVTVLEELEYRGTGPMKERVDDYFAIVTVEESLEMLASLGFLLSLLAAVQRLGAGDRDAG